MLFSKYGMMSNVLFAMLGNGLADNSSTKFEDPWPGSILELWCLPKVTIEFAATSHALRYITWSMHRGRFFSHIWNP